MFSAPAETFSILSSLAAGLPLAVHNGPWPSVAILVPARDEAALIGQTVSGLLGQDYPGDVHVFMIDDHSTDGTAARASEAARACGRSTALSLVAAPPLPAGWTGKLWALAAGHKAAGESFAQAEFLWLCDADIGHPPSALRRLVSHALSDRRDLVSLMVLLKANGFWGRVLVPPFVVP
jgi:glycosyltransferase involved in cell wall biosynthesis